MKKITIVMLTLLTSLWNLMAQPATGAPEPPARAAADVISVFSGAYTDLAGTDFNPNWGQGTVVSFEEIDGNNAMRYSNLNYQGTQLASAIDASLMDTLHLDLYTDDIAISAEIFLISPGAVPVEKSFSLPTEPGVWQSVDIALSEFSDVVDISNVIQFKITDTAGSTIYFDNLYFYRPAPAAGTDASLSDLQIDGVTIANFNTNTLNYFFGLEEGTTVVPTVTVTTTDENAEAVITAAAQIPDTTVIVVTAADGTTTLTYRVAFAIAFPATGAPAPPARNASDVISVFSGAYTDLSGTDFNPNWGQSTQVSFTDFDGNNTMKYANLNYQGTVLGGNVDVSLMDTLHLDMWANSATSVDIYLISPGPAETPYSLPITQGSWQSYNIPLTAFSSVVNLAEVFQFKIVGTNGSTIFLDNIYFYKPAAPEGTDATLSDLQIDGVTITGFSANTLNYFVGLEEGTTVVPTVTVTTTDENAEAVVTAATEIPDTAVIVVTAEDGTTTLTYRVAFAIAFPATGAPVPPARNASDVISVFSGTYTDLSGTDFNPNWGQSTQVSFSDFDGNNTMKYTNLNYQGTVLGGNIDVSMMDTLHLDMWTNSATSVDIYLISPGPAETPYSLPITQGSWQSYNIPLTAFSSVVNLTEVFQFKIVGTNGSTIFLDNIYFYKPADVAGSDATLSDLQIDGATIDNFNPNTLNYFVGLVEGTSVVPTVTATATDENAEAVITAATEIPDTTVIVVTAADGVTTRTYSVAFAITIPAAGAPEPVARNANDVISVFSGAFTNLEGTNFNPGWGQSTQVTTIDIGGNSTLKYSNLNYQGTELSGNVDVSAMDTLHIDMWTNNAVSVDFFLISPGPDEKAYSLPITAGSWQSYDIPLSTYADVVNLAEVFQFKVVGTNGSTVYFDNIYFYNGLSNDATLSDLQVDGSVVEGFSASTLNYSVVLPYGTTDVPVVSATTNDTNASAVIDHAASLPGTTSIEVTAEDGTTVLTYTIGFTVALPSDDATLSDLLINGVTIPGFASDKMVYDIELAVGTTTVPAITATVNHSGAEAQVTNATELPGTTTITVTAQDGTTVLTYTVNMTIRLEVSSDATLSNLKVNNVTVNGFDAGTFGYSVELPYGTNVVPVVTVATNDLAAGYVVANAESLPGTTSIVVTAEDGTTILTYTVEFTLALPATDATLSDLLIDGAVIGGFTAGTLSYTVELPFGTADVPVVTATTNDEDADAVIASAVTLPGSTTVTVTAQDGTTTTVYTVNFTIADGLSLPIGFETGSIAFVDFDGGAASVIDNPQQSGNNTSAKVARMVKNNGQIWGGAYFNMDIPVDFSTKNGITMKVFSPRAGVPVLFKLENGAANKFVELTVNTTVANEWETLTYNFSGAESDVYTRVVTIFDMGTNGDGTANFTFLFDDIEQVEIVTPPSNDATLSDLQVSGTTIEGFSGSTYTYNVVLPSGTTEVPIVTATANNNDASVAVTPASALPGTTTIVVTAEDGTTEITYTVSFTVSTVSNFVPVFSNVQVYSADRMLYVNSNENLFEGTIEVFEITGKKVVSASILSDREQISLNASGLLIVRVISPQGLVVLSEKILCK